MLFSALILSLAALVQTSLGEKALLGKISEEQKKKIVDLHNAIRRQVKPPASNMLKMMWNEDAAKSAERWVSKCILTSSPKAERTVNGRICGEISLQANYFPTWEMIMDEFSKGSKYFKYGIGATDIKQDNNSYTQLIWHNSYQVGCAAAICPEDETKYFYVCRYCPQGNLLEKLNTPYKSGPSCGDCPKNCEDKLCNRSCKYDDSYDECGNIIKTLSCKNKYAEETCPATCKCPKGVL